MCKKNLHICFEKQKQSENGKGNPKQPLDLQGK